MTFRCANFKLSRIRQYLPHVHTVASLLLLPCIFHTQQNIPWDMGVSQYKAFVDTVDGI